MKFTTNLTVLASIAVLLQPLTATPIPIPNSNPISGEIFERTPTKLKPISDRIIVQPGQGSSKSASGLIIPDTAAEKPAKGVVIAVGKGHHSPQGNTKPISIPVGTTIKFSKHQ